MKTSWLFISLLVLAVVSTPGQVSPPGAPANAGQGTTKAQDTPYAVVEQGANHRVWQRTTYETLPSGQKIPHVHQYTELATGLNYQKNGQWMESKEEIELFSGGAIARQGQHQVIFANNLATVGAIDMQTPDGRRLRSHVLGLSYFDTASGQSVLIAEVKDNQGQLYPPNVVIYPDAFTDFKADVRYTYTRAGFEQDIILHERPPGPEAYGLNPATTKLQVLTEFLNPPQLMRKQMTLKTRQGDALDEDLDFGAMHMGRGKAFSLERGGEDIPVSKQWLKLEGRDFLVEEVGVPDLEEELQSLPAAEGASLNPAAGSVLHVVSVRRLLPVQRLTRTHPSGSVMQLAQTATSTRGLVLDYTVTLNYQTNYTFRGDTTYYILACLYSYGTTIFEGGAVLKYSTNGTIQLIPGGGFSNPTMGFQGTAYRPVVFTGKDDNSVGETISGSTGSPSVYYGNPMLYLVNVSPVPNLTGLRMSYAKTAMQFGGASANLYSAQIVNCQSGFILGGANVPLGNALFVNTKTNFIFQGGSTITAEHATFSGSIFLATASSTQQGNSLRLTNCILANVTNLLSGVFYVTNGNYNGFYNTPEVFGNPVTNTFYPFQSVGAGNYYLTNGCAFTNAGSAGIDPALLAALAQKTTHPPLWLTNTTVSVNTNLNPQAARDTQAAPDLGYHYDPIDYIADQWAITNATLTLTNGVAIATCNEAGFRLQDGGKITSTGSPISPNWFVRYSSVQEQPISLKGTNSGGIAVLPAYTSAMPSAQYRFTKFACSAGGGIHLYDYAASSCSNLLVQDCEFWSGANTLGGTSGAVLTLKNNLFARSVINASGNGSLSLSNTLMWGASSVQLNPSGASAWYAFNNDFDSCTITNSTLTNGYNAYLNCSGRLYPTNAHDVVSNTTLAYQTSFLGTFYQPTNSPLINAGSTTAGQVGLYHYTVTTNQVKDANSTVDIGYHYVALNSQPSTLTTVDSNGNGIPDYWEDANGNGLVDHGETNWGLAILTQPVSQVVPQGTNVTFAVTAGGIAPLSCQWYFNGTNLAGATSTSLNLTNVQVVNMGNYQVVITNVIGMMTSSVVTLALTCDASPSGLVGWWPGDGDANDIVGDNDGTLQNGTGYASGEVGQAFSFNGINQYISTSTEGLTDITNTFTMEFWAYPTAGRTITAEGNSGISGTCCQRYTISPKQSPDGSALAGAGVSVGTNGISVFELAANYMPSLLVCQTPILGWTHVAVVYQNKQPTLFINGVLVRTGQTSSRSAVYPSAELGGDPNGYGYYAGLLDEASIYNRALSSNEIAAIYNAGSVGKCQPPPTPPTITAQPTGQSASVGSTVTLMVVATGSPLLSYQWYFNGTNLIAGATNATLILSNLQSTNSGNYSVVVSNSEGTTVSTNALLDVETCFSSVDVAMVIDRSGSMVNTNSDGMQKLLAIRIASTNFVQNLNFSNDQAALFSFASDVSTNSTLTNSLPILLQSISLVTNASGSTYMGNALQSAQAELASPRHHLYALPVMVFLSDGEPTDNSNSVLNAATLIKAAGKRLITVAFGTDAATNFMKLMATSTNDFYYANTFSQLTNVYSLIASSICRGNTNIAPMITQQPANVTTNVGGSAIFSVTVSTNSMLPLSYQWWFNTTNLLVRATNASLTLSNVQTTNAGNYLVVVTNVAGSVTSSNAVLTVIVPPVITVQPTNQTVFQGSNTTFSVTATGTLPLSYQWYFNSGVLANATNAVLTLTGVTTNQAGTYLVTVTNAAGSAVSSNAVLTVNSLLPIVQITAPVNQTLLARSNVIISATATNVASGVTISWVEFFSSATNSLGFVVVPTNGLYQLNWMPPIGGTNVLTALAMNSQGQTAWSQPVTNYVRSLPLVSITSPANGQIFSAFPTNIIISAIAVGDRAMIANVVFYQGTNIVGTTNIASPFYTITWTNVASGTYTLHARATDSAGISGISSNIVITIEPANQPPAVFVGPNQTNYLSTNTVPLIGIVSDDGLPVGSTLSVTWTNLNGGTNVTFVNSNLPVTSAYFWATGTFVFQLSASDSQYTTSSNFTMTILPANNPPYVYAGTNQTIILPALVNTNPVQTIQLTWVTNIAGMIGLDYFPASNCLIASVNWNVGSPYNFALVFSNGTSQPFSAISHIGGEVNIATVKDTLGGFKVGELFCGNNQPGMIMRIEPDGTTIGTNMWVDNNDPPNNTNYNAWLVLSNDLGMEPAVIEDVYVDRTGVWGGDLIAVTGDGGYGTGGDVWRIKSNGHATLVAQLRNDYPNNHEGGLLTVPDDAGKYGPWAGCILSGGQYRGDFYSVDTNGVVLAYPVPFSVQELRIIPENENCYGVDGGEHGYDGKLYGVPASQFQGMAGDIIIVEENPLDPNKSGGYVFRAHWNGIDCDFFPLTDSLNVWEQIAFTPMGLAGVPSANSVQLQGAVIDDNELFSPTSNNWSVVSSPGPVTLGDPTQTNTMAEFSVPGDYILQLSADDGQYTSSSNVTIHILRNQAPVVSAGRNQIITNTITTLHGNVSDDGLPRGVTNIVWTEASGPTQVAITASNQAQTSINFYYPGTYVLMLTADDGQATNSAQVMITVESSSLILTPSYGSATRTNTYYSVTNRLVDANGSPIPSVTVNFTVSGANQTSTPIPMTTDVNGNAVFSYQGVTVGRDKIQAYYQSSPTAYSPIVIKDWGRNISCGDILLNQPPGQRGCQSREWPTNGNYPADYYVYNGTTNESIQLTLVQKGLPLMLFLRDPFDQLLAYSPVSFTDQFNSTGIGDVVSLNYTLPENGDFVIEVAAIYGSGNYDLYLSCSDDTNGPQMQVLYNGTNIPSGGTIAFPPTSQGVQTNITLVITNAGNSPFNMVGLGTNGDFTLNNFRACFQNGFLSQSSIAAI